MVALAVLSSRNNMLREYRPRGFGLRAGDPSAGLNGRPGSIELSLLVILGLNLLLLLDYWSNLLTGRRWRGHLVEIRGVVLLIG